MKLIVESVVDYSRIAEIIDINGPSYRGADYPPDKKLSINERNIPDGMRAKWFDCKGTDTGFELELLTQEDFGYREFDKFMDEVQRLFSRIASAYKLDNFNVKLKVECRSGREYGYAEGTLTYDDGDFTYEDESYTDDYDEELDDLMREHEGLCSSLESLLDNYGIDLDRFVNIYHVDTDAVVFTAKNTKGISEEDIETIENICDRLDELEEDIARIE